MKKVLFLLQLYPPVHGASMAGEYVMSSKLINKSYSCDYVRISTKSLKKPVFFQIFNFFKLYFIVLKLLLKTRYDLIYITPTASGFQFYKDLGICVMAKIFCKKVIYHYHNKGISSNKLVPKLLLKNYFKNCTVILASKLLKYDISDYVSDENIYYLPYGIPAETKETIKKENEKCVLLFFSHMIIEKGALDLLEACKILNSKGIDFICNFVGGWYNISEELFNSMVKKYNLSNIVFYLGPQYGNAKDIVLNSTDIFTFPTFYANECFPLGILEALKFSLPVITTSEGALSEIIEDGKTGYIIPKNDPISLSEKIEILIKDKERRIFIGKAGNSKFKNEYTIDKFEENILNIFNSVINN